MLKSDAIDTLQGFWVKVGCMQIFKVCSLEILSRMVRRCVVIHVKLQDKFLFYGCVLHMV